MLPYQYRKSNYVDGTILRTSQPQLDFLYWQDGIFILNLVKFAAATTTASIYTINNVDAVVKIAAIE